MSGQTYQPVSVPHTPDRAMALLDKASKAGKLPGYAKLQSVPQCAVEAYGTVFDHQLNLTFAQSESGSIITFDLIRLSKKPIIIAVVLLICIWPGLPMTDSMLRTWWGWYDTLPLWATAAWYLPFTVLPMPFMWKRWSTESHASAVAHSYEQIQTISEVLQGATVQ